jgi:hypothetical protein
LTANGNGWFGKQAATWRRVPRALLSMHNGKRKPLRSSSVEMAYLTRTDPTRNINRFYVVDITPTLFGDWTVLREWGRRGSSGTVRLTSYRQHG